MRWDEQRRCGGRVGGKRCELRDDHSGEHEVGLSRAHGPPWEHDRCFHFAGGDGTRCVLIYGHSGEHVIDGEPAPWWERIE